MSQLEDNLRAVEIQLTRSEIQRLYTLTQPLALYPHWFNQQLIDPKQQEIFK
jgi:hypothetical protein